MLSCWMCYMCLFQIETILGQIPKYYTKPGFFTPNSCPSENCQTCPSGEYLKGCERENAGICQTCTNSLPSNAQWKTPSFVETCPFECKTAYVLSSDGLSCVVGPDSGYQVAVTIALPLSASGVNSVLDELVASFAALGGCGQCGSSTAVPVVCDSCKLYITVTQLSARRRNLLAASSSVEVKIVKTQEASANTVLSALTETNINTQLAAASIPAAQVTSPAEKSVVLLNPPSPPPSPPPSTPPPPPSPPGSSPTGKTTPVPNSSSGDSGNSNTGIIVGVVVSVVLVVVIVVVVYFVLRQNQNVVVTRIPPPPSAPPSNAARTPRSDFVFQGGFPGQYPGPPQGGPPPGNYPFPGQSPGRPYGYSPASIQPPYYNPVQPQTNFKSAYEPRRRFYSEPVLRG